MEKKNRLSLWSWITVALIGFAVLYTDLSRFRDPVGEKYITYMTPGAADFILTFNGTRAILAGVNPYHNDSSEFDDPWGRDKLLNTENGFKQYYPVSHFVLYMPLALITSGNSHRAGKLWFHFNLLCLGLLALLVWYFSFSILHLKSEFGPFLCFYSMVALSLHSGTELGLERGQSDLFLATLCWFAVCFAWKNRPFETMLLVTAATSIKGYTLLLAMGLGLLFVNRKQILPAVGGGLVSLAVLILPGYRYFKDGVDSMQVRANMFWDTWFNHGFKNLVYYFSPRYADLGRAVLVVLSLIATVFCWSAAKSALKKKSGSETEGLWLIAFSVSALGTMLGVSSLSIDYNLILILPGVLVLAFGYQRLFPEEEVKYSSRFKTGTGFALALSVFLLWFPAVHSEHFSTAAVGILGVIGILGAIALLALVLGMSKPSMARL
jgi:hypothetical protein